jgi:hypothetical protein
MKAKLLYGAGRSGRYGSEQGIHMNVCCVSRSWLGIGESVRQKNWRGIAQTVVQSTVKSEVFGLAEFVVHKKREYASEGELVKRSASQLSSGELFFKGARGDDDRANFRAMVAEYGNVALVSGSGNAKDPISKRSVTITICRDKTNATGLYSGKKLVVMKVSGIMCSGGLCAIVEMSTGTTEIFVQQRSRGDGIVGQEIS